MSGELYVLVIKLCVYCRVRWYERILKIDQHLAKLWAIKYQFSFLYETRCILYLLYVCQWLIAVFLYELPVVNE